MTTLKLGDEPTTRLKEFRTKRAGVAQLRTLLEAIGSSAGNVAGIAFTIKHRPPRNLEAIEDVLIKHLAWCEDALAHVRRMRLYRDRPVSAMELASHEPAQQEALRV